MTEQGISWLLVDGCSLGWEEGPTRMPNQRLNRTVIAAVCLNRACSLVPGRERPLYALLPIWDCHYNRTSQARDLTARRLQQLTTPLSHLSYKKALLKNLRSLGIFRAWAIHLLARPSINLSVFQTMMFWNCLASPCVRHTDLQVGNINTHNFYFGYIRTY